MTTFYFIRHGQMDTSMAGEKFYKGFAFNMMTLSENGIEQIHETAKDGRLRSAELIITSPFGRAMHSAAILSRDLNLELRVETDLHEWLADGVSYEFLPAEMAEASYRSLTEHHGQHPEGTQPLWESAGQMRERVTKVLDKYKDYHAVIVVCHGTLMQYVLGIDHPENGQIEALVY
ncbi:MAG: histidine phosphatase family protein [Lachnospiraceae bacterium]